MNVGTTKKKWDDIFHIIDTQKLDVIVLQESREIWNEIKGFIVRMTNEGWKVFISDAMRSEDGGKNGGVMTLSRWPMRKATSRTADQNTGRVLCTWLDLPGRRPIRISNIYLKSSSKEEACELGNKILNECAECGDDSLVVGDWNRLPHEEPAAPFLIEGTFEVAGDFLGQENREPTHKKRCIDYALVKGTKPTGKETHEGVEGPNGHKLIVYSYEVENMPKNKVWTKFIGLKKDMEINDDMWEEHWKSYEDMFEKTKRKKDIDGMLGIWYDAMEELMRDSKTKNTRKRSQGPKATIQQAVSNKAICWMSVKEAKLRKIGRRAKELAKNPTPETERKQRMRLYRLSKEHPEWDINVKEDATNEKYWIILANKQSREDRIMKAEVRRQKLENNESALRKYLRAELDEEKPEDVSSVHGIKLMAPSPTGVSGGKERSMSMMTISMTLRPV